MKKQVLSFCALFGLVLVLSVYYILLPNNLFVSQNVNNQVDETLNVNYTIEETTNLYFATLNEKLEEKHQDIIYSYEVKVASDEVLNQEKEVALNLIDFQLKLKNSEEYLVSLLKEMGYYNAYVEYLDDMIKVIVQSSTLSNQEVANIISIIMENSVNGLLPEVSYI